MLFSSPLVMFMTTDPSAVFRLWVLFAALGGIFFVGLVLAILAECVNENENVKGSDTIRIFNEED